MDFTNGDLVKRPSLSNNHSGADVSCDLLFLVKIPSHWRHIAFVYTFYLSSLVKKSIFNGKPCNHIKMSKD